MRVCVCVSVMFPSRILYLGETYNRDAVAPGSKEEEIYYVVVAVVVVPNAAR